MNADPADQAPGRPPRPFLGETRVFSHENLGTGYRRLMVDFPISSHPIRPGQFFLLKVAPALDPILRRPLSVHRMETDPGRLTFLYAVVGRGTHLLSLKRKGESIDLLGPLGRGFTPPPSDEDILLIGGGMGTAPLRPLAEELAALGRRPAIYLGAASRTALVGEAPLAALGLPLKTATVDGSAGTHGTVIDLLMEDRIWTSRREPWIYACGPHAMLAALAEAVRKTGRRLRGQVSLESHMACGVGACVGCAWPRSPSAGGGYAMVCSDGPVFSFDEVVIA